MESKPLTDSEIVDLIQTDLQNGIKFADGALTKERSEALQYYYGDLPRRLHKGSSGYRSLDVYDQVETARSMLMETFIGNELPVKIHPGKNKVAGAVAAAMATQYVNDVIFTHNDGESILDQTIFDALVARIGVVRVDWAEDTKTQQKLVTGLTMDQVNALAQDDQIVEIEVEPAEESPEDELVELWDATLTIETDSGSVKLSGVRPEDFIVNTSAQDAYEYAIAQRLTKRMSVWQAEGYAEDDLKNALTEEDQAEYEEALIRNNAGSDDAPDRPNDPMVTLLDAYAYIDMANDGNPRYWNVLLAGSKVLEKNQAEDHPFVFYVPIRVPHIFHGMQFVKPIIPTANAKTALTRSVIDHAMRTNNPRYTVLRGTFDSPRELLENKFGGIVNINKPDGVQPLPQAGLNPFVFETVKMLDTDLSDTTGISRLTQGVDKDAISKQNSQGMMRDLAQASETRLRVMARRFATGFLKELARKVYAVAVANDGQKTSCVVDGKPMDVSPAEWPPEADIRVSLELSPAQREKRVGEIVQLLSVLQSDEQLGKSLDYGYKRRMAVEVLKLQGFPDAEMALSPEEPQPGEMEQRIQKAEVEAREAEVMIQKTNAQAGMMKAETERMRALKEFDLDTQKLLLEQWQSQAEYALDERKQVFNEAMGLYEKKVMEEKMRQDPESVKAIAAIDS
jgi:hypothetical protein